MTFNYLIASALKTLVCCFVVPGMVGEVNWYGRINSVLLNWTIPEKNPQCVESYLVTWQNQSQKTNETYFKIEEEPCSTFPVTISSLPAIELLNSTSPSISVFVSTNSVGTEYFLFNSLFLTFCIFI